tara:strand:+ start:55 stop:657 length:603 start_codon:yes stop_codon:yes gene_type:complete
MTIGNELDQAFYNLGQRIARLEKKEVEYPIKNDPTERIAELVDHEISARVNGDLERIEAELNDRIDELENDMGFDPDDLRCDLESRIEEVADNLSYESDRIDDIESYKITEEEVEYMLDRRLEDMDDVISDKVTDCVCDEINTRAVGFTEWTTLRDRVKELEDRLNKPTLGARVLRWLREGPSAKELATKWYAGLRRARV